MLFVYKGFYIPGELRSDFLDKVRFRVLEIIK